MTLRQCPPHPSLSLIVPLYNEEDNLQLLVESVFAVLAEDPNFLELLLIDDGSSDRTAALALRLANRERRIRLLSHDRNRGLGAAIRTGLEKAYGELILYTDGDLPFDFKLIPQLLTLATPDNVVVGCRTNHGDGAYRWLLSKGYNLLCRYLLGLHLRDVNFACKIIPRRALSRLQLNSEGSFVDAELLLECRRQGLAMTEFPLAYYPRIRGKSTLSRPKVILGILAEMVAYLFRPSYICYWKCRQAILPSRSHSVRSLLFGSGSSYARRRSHELVEKIDHKRG